MTFKCLSCALLAKESTLRLANPRILSLAPRRFNSTSKKQIHDKPTFIKPSLNYRYIRDNVDHILQNMVRRNYSGVDVKDVARKYNSWCEMRTRLDQMLAHRNEVALKLQNKNISRETRTSLIEEGRKLKEEIQQSELRLNTEEQALLEQALLIPNDTHPDAPIGDESHARVLRTFGLPPPPDHPNKNHLDIAQKLDLVDFENAAKVSGTSFYYLKREAVLLELALIQHALSKAVSHGYTPVTTPDLVRTEIAHGCGFRPRSTEASQIYEIEDTDSSPLCLAGTAEIPLAGMHAGALLKHSDLPTRLVGIGRAFRREAGSRGAEDRGLYRVHQFTKVELFAFSLPQESEAMMGQMCELQEEIIRDLGLHYRLLDMPTEELGASAYRKYDIEAWMPGRNGWGEISSLSNCTDYQSRRLNIRYQPPGVGAGNKKPHTEFVHTLNGTAVAIPRVIIAILEQYQTSDGRVAIPEVLQKYMGGCKYIESRK
ncbi:uncharacterized protein VTP21DRAFT_3394 [Calcarisporiella thermophila]|uniref:uncharacterized protein n=1 Tax=Calcarisporiella thermophila TaxID=911321 RepID=UPI0037445DB2